MVTRTMTFNLNFNKYDRIGQKLTPGDVCARAQDDRVELVVFKGGSKGGSGSKGQYGRFITSKGVRTFKYTSVVFVFDAMTNRRAKTDEVNSMVKQFYERN